MEISNIISGVSAFIAAIALIVSIFADRRSKKLDVLLKQKEIDKSEREEEEEKKADVEVNKVEMPKGHNDVLRFYNKGLAEAKNINITINSDPEDYITLNIQKDYLPYPKLLPQQNFDIAYWSNSDKPHQTIVITWDDEYGKGRSKEMIIDI